MQSGLPSSMQLKVALFGYGKMGKSVAKAAKERGHLVGPIASSPQDNPSLDEVDVIIDFTSPESVVDNVQKAGKAGKNIVIGTTGWQDRMEVVKEMVEKYQIGALYSPNFSIGVLLFIQIVETAAKMISSHCQYDVGGLEIHHKEKKDAPSGTAKSLAKAVMKNWREEKKELDFASSRFGFNPGTHTITFDSPADTITLTHAAKGREGFANGALLAAEWLQSKKGFYTLEDLLCNSKGFTPS